MTQLTQKALFHFGIKLLHRHYYLSRWRVNSQVAITNNAVLLVIAHRFLSIENVIEF